MTDAYQWGTVLKLLKQGKKVHRYLCRELYGTESLHSIISYLSNRKKIPIQSEWVYKLDYRGQRKHVKEYWLEIDCRDNKKQPVHVSQLDMFD
jgi:hypothetical protein